MFESTFEIFEVADVAAVLRRDGEVSLDGAFELKVEFQRHLSVEDALLKANELCEIVRKAEGNRGGGYEDSDTIVPSVERKLRHVLYRILQRQQRSINGDSQGPALEFSCHYGEYEWSSHDYHDPDYMHYRVLQFVDTVTGQKIQLVCELNSVIGSWFG